MKKISVVFWQGDVKESVTYEGETYNDALILADRDIFTRYYVNPNHSMFLEILEAVEDGETHRNWSWFTIQAIR